ncbi:glucose-6-phosphate dehydrogenase [Zopfochytrium polystomum]|nr:glucose-6-phosphate dehydrogenase [Zopfochytrium polystomum]
MFQRRRAAAGAAAADGSDKGERWREAETKARAVLKVVKSSFARIIRYFVFEQAVEETDATVASDDNTVIIVLGASGDLAFKKTYPALFGLFKNGFLPKNCQIVGYSRSAIALPDFHARISSKIKFASETERGLLPSFLARCTYVSGKYDDMASFERLNEFVSAVEVPGAARRHRIFYMALPPSVFIPASRGLKAKVYSNSGANRLIVEKPFGKDYDSSKELSVALGTDWSEDEIFRIDHYLGKEMVKSIMVFRFANLFFGAIWNRNYISNVQITFKEKIGTEGRGGYFDEFGIIRDVMQNHLLQILTVVAMERPLSLDAEDIRNEKVKVLRQVQPIKMENVLLGQYVANDDHTEAGYIDDPTVPRGSLTATYAAAALFISSERWEGVPFILKCGKALNEAKAEIRIQFRDVAGSLYDNIGRNELVIRVQPNEALYIKLCSKEPGLSNLPVMSELDLSYSTRYRDVKIPDAYESLILDVLREDKSNFVRDDELDAAWKIFTPLLHKIEKEQIRPAPYKFGSRGPPGTDAFIEKFGYKRSKDYKWGFHL